MISIKSSALYALIILSGIALLMSALFIICGCDSIIHNYKGGEGLLVFGSLIFLISTAVLCLLISTLFKKYWILKKGTDVKAVIKDIQISKGNIRVVFEYHVTYEYLDESGFLHSGKCTVPGPVGGQWSIGKEIAIRYQKNKPDRSICIIDG